MIGGTIAVSPIFVIISILTFTTMSNQLSVSKGSEIISLTKQSSENDIKKYFNAVLELSKSDNEFPINLDEVWQLVYAERGKAVRALTNNFIENVDFILVAQNGKQKSLQGSGGHNKVSYYLSLSCLEYFIARKVRPVFEVYRMVFHKAVMQPSLPNFSNPAEAARAWALEYEQRLALEAKNSEQAEVIEIQTQEIKKAAPKVKYYDDVMCSKDTYTTSQIANMLGMSAGKLNEVLKNIGVIYKQSGQWLLKKPYVTWGLHSVRTHIYIHSNGNQGTNSWTVWTERGRCFISALRDNNFDVKKAIAQIKGVA